MNIMAKGSATGIMIMLNRILSPRGTERILLSPIVMMTAAQRLIIRWVIPRKYWSARPSANMAQSHGIKTAPTIRAAMPVKLIIWSMSLCRPSRRRMTWMTTDCISNTARRTIGAIQIKAK